MNSKYITIGILVLIVVLLVAFRNKLTTLFSKSKAAVNTPVVVTTNQNLPPVNPVPSLNRDLILKKGVRGPEVKYLQHLLGITEDGIFGPVTEGALQDAKCATETTLNSFDSQTCVTADENSFDFGNHGDWSSAEDIYNNVLSYIL